MLEEDRFTDDYPTAAIVLRKAQSQGSSLKSSIFTVNLPGKDHRNGFEEFLLRDGDPIPSGSLLYRFINGDDAFLNQRRA
ncbi:hypothetical protein Dsin_019344 [Dipteronia sinensis]|uniref:Uncharacterized protein n=1 Tax=Dipteronia sinensis TaxID=43782 RepID=A0AAE0A8F8_9ROSI|nr:hypothetical protein Dsin_019344 [Dipteronia sinensis]